jgi:AraC-like DNA-binding protein
VVALTGTLRIREGRRARWRRCRGVVVKANAAHEIDASDSLVLMVFVGKESTLGAALTRGVRPAVGIVSNGQAARWRRTLGDPKSLDSTRVKRWVGSTLLGNRSSVPVHPRLEPVIRMLRDDGLGTPKTSLVALATISGLSPSRFGHVFTESMGVPLRPYLRWLRLQRAARELVSGRSITQAAHIAGFADAAHLTRTFRRLLGTAPRDVIARAALNVDTLARHRQKTHANDGR